MQKSLITGRLAGQPEMRAVGTEDLPLAEFEVEAVRYKSKGEKRVSYFHVKAWGRHAENISKFFVEGQGIVLDCLMEQERWEDEITGEPRERVIHHVKSWEFGPSARGGETPQPGGRTTHHGAQQPSPATPGPRTTHELARQLEADSQEIPF